MSEVGVVRDIKPMQKWRRENQANGGETCVKEDVEKDASNVDPGKVKHFLEPTRGKLFCLSCNDVTVTPP